MKLATFRDRSTTYRYNSDRYIYMETKTEAE